MLVAAGASAVVLAGVGVGVADSHRGANSQDLASAQSLVLKASDLPTGWDATPDSSAGASAGLYFDKRFDECLGTDTSVFDNHTVRASSDHFSTNNGATGIHNTVYISTSAAVAEQIFEIAAGPKAPSCERDVFQANLPSSGATRRLTL
jgi:hypothetical protein